MAAPSPEPIASTPMEIRTRQPGGSASVSRARPAEVPVDTNPQAIEREFRATVTGPETGEAEAKAEAEAEAQGEDGRALREATEARERSNLGRADQGSKNKNVSAQVQRMRVQEQEVRRTQVIKAAVGGAFAGDSTYQFALGPDGHRYIVGGDVAFDVSPVENNPRATISKMRRIRAAAGVSVQTTQSDRVTTFMSVRTEGSARSQLAKMANFRSGQRSTVGGTVDESA